MTPTEILDVLIGEIAEEAAGLLCARLLTRAPRLVDHDAIRSGSRDEGKAIAELGPAAVVVHAQPRKGVPKDAAEEERMPAENNVSGAFGERWSCRFIKAQFFGRRGGVARG